MGFFPKKVAMLKKMKGGPFSLFAIEGFAETFLVQFLGPTGTIWRLLKIL